MSTHTITNLDEMATFVDYVRSILPQESGAQTIALSGDLGAGKTTFIQILARKLGVTEHVTSPTFVIMRTYETGDKKYTKLVHIDAYRVEDEREMDVLHIPEMFNEDGTVVCIEWPENIAGLIPTDALNIAIEVHENGSRMCTIKE